MTYCTVCVNLNSFVDCRYCESLLSSGSSANINLAGDVIRTMMETPVNIFTPTLNTALRPVDDLIDHQ